MSLTVSNIHFIDLRKNGLLRRESSDGTDEQDLASCRVLGALRSAWLLFPFVDEFTGERGIQGSPKGVRANTQTANSMIPSRRENRGPVDKSPKVEEIHSF